MKRAQLVGCALVTAALTGAHCTQDNPKQGAATSSEASSASPSAKPKRQRTSPTDARKALDDVFTKPDVERAARLRSWASTDAEFIFQTKAIQHLATSGDPETAQLAQGLLASDDHTVRAVAAQALAHVALGGTAEGGPALKKALAGADDTDRVAIVWALVTLKDASIFDAAMQAYREGKLALVRRLDGGSAFDPLRLTALTPLERAAELATDPSEIVRMLAARALASAPDARWVAALVKLSSDSDVYVRALAVAGLTQSPGDDSVAALRAALGKATRDDFAKYIDVIRDVAGGEALLVALQNMPDGVPEEERWSRTKSILDALEALGNPRAADALLRWVMTTSPSEHWSGEAGRLIAILGNPRGASLVAKRLAHAPTDLYPMARFWEADASGHLSRSDNARVRAVTALDDLVRARPDVRDEVRGAVEDAVLAWMKAGPQPHARGLLLLGRLHSEKARGDLWSAAFTTAPLPKEGASPPFPMEWEIAPSALRAVGARGEPDALEPLVRSLDRRADKKLDVSQEALMAGGIAMLGMAVRGSGLGAAQGLAELADPRAATPLEAMIEDATLHEEARMAACHALAFALDDAGIGLVAKRMVDLAASKEASKSFMAGCYGATLRARPARGAVAGAIALMSPSVQAGALVALAAMIGRSGLTPPDEALLFPMLDKPETRVAAALALALGGSESSAGRAVAMLGKAGPAALDELKDPYHAALAPWSKQDLDDGALARAVRNAEAIARVEIDGLPQTWVISRLRSQLDQVRADQGPHVLTRTMARILLTREVFGADEARARGALRVLLHMNEAGAIQALTGLTGHVADAARATQHELMNPPLLPSENR